MIENDDIDPKYLRNYPMNNFKFPENKSFKDHLYNAWISILYSILAEVSGVIRDIPTYNGSKYSVTYDISLKYLEYIENPSLLYTLPDRDNYFNKLGYMLWSLDNMIKGIV